MTLKIQLETWRRREQMTTTTSSHIINVPITHFLFISHGVAGRVAVFPFR